MEQLSVIQLQSFLYLLSRQVPGARDQRPRQREPDLGRRRLRLPELRGHQQGRQRHQVRTVRKNCNAFAMFLSLSKDSSSVAETTARGKQEEEQQDRRRRRLRLRL